MRSKLMAGAVAVAALAAVVIVASAAAVARTQTRAVSPVQRSFDLFRIVGPAPDFTDPGLAYNGASWQLNWNVYLGLVGYPHVTGPGGARLVPYLAQTMPKVTGGGKRFVFTLRSGLLYSDGSSVKASDFACTMERLFQINSPGVGFYEAIAGVSGPNGYAAKPQGHISGITTNDAARTITIQLSHPEADFLNTLALPFAALLPCGTPATDQSLKPIPSTGPYMIKSYDPNRSEVQVRNPYFSKSIAAVPQGNPAEIDWTVVDDAGIAAQDVISGSADYDAQPLPTDRIGQISSSYSNQLKVEDSSSTAWFFLNTQTPPFNKLAARQAVNYAINRKALVSLLGGLARPTENILPQSYPQYRKITAYSYNLAKARQLVRQSGTVGMHVSVWTASSAHDKDPAEYLASMLSKIGWKVDLKVIAPSVYYATIGNQSTKAQIGYASWGQDYPNPIDWLDVLFNGNRITPTHNNNYGNVNFPDVNKLLDQLKNTPETTAAQDASWAKAEKMLIVDHAAAAPFASMFSTDFFGANVALSCYHHHVLYGFDAATICLKGK